MLSYLFRERGYKSSLAVTPKILIEKIKFLILMKVLLRMMEFISIKSSLIITGFISYPLFRHKKKCIFCRDALLSVFKLAYLYFLRFIRLEFLFFRNRNFDFCVCTWGLTGFHFVFLYADHHKTNSENSVGFFQDCGGIRSESTFIKPIFCAIFVNNFIIFHYSI